MKRIAVIDIGTVTARLAISDTDQGRLKLLHKQSTICNLGEGLTESGSISTAARERVRNCVAGYLSRSREAGAQLVACTLTSAARDADNSQELLDDLVRLGLAPEVIPGTVEGRLTFLGVAQDFCGKRILVADNGGGSTELALGTLGDEVLDLEAVRSEQVGARRVTERFLSRTDPPSPDDLAEARAYADGLFAAAAAEEGLLLRPPECLVVTGGTATTLVALDAGLDPYDSSYVHLHELTQDEVEQQLARLASLTVEQRAQLKGIQTKRAPVILGGAVCIAELMKQTGFKTLRVSESDLLVGLTLVAEAAATEQSGPIGWLPRLAMLE